MKSHALLLSAIRIERHHNMADFFMLQLERDTSVIRIII